MKKKTKVVRCIQNNKNSDSLMVTLPPDWRIKNDLTKSSLLKFTYDDKSIIITKIEVD
jgi:hypothetical protein